jgi:drug/metabolite transporter (DMT)-like permease
MSVLLALGGALAYGLSDFIGGVASRRTSVWPVALTACLGAALGTLVLAALVPGEPTAADFAWGVLAGFGSGAGTAFLYRGFARGRMGVVAPVSAVGAALLPAALGVATGERPTLVVWVGMVVALPGIWLVSREPEQVDSTLAGPSSSAAPATAVRASTAEGLVDGVVAGLGFGLLFAALGQIPEEAGFWPVAGNQVVSLVAVTAAALLLGGDPVPRRRGDWWGLSAGVLATLAVVGFMLARQQGLLSVAAVLTSLYPAATVLLASLVLKERLHGGQSLGLLLCAVSVVCVALG